MLVVTKSLIPNRMIHCIVPDNFGVVSALHIYQYQINCLSGNLRNAMGISIFRICKWQGQLLQAIRLYQDHIPTPA